MTMAEPLRALVVDDSEVIRDLITLNLQLDGLEVTQADGGLAALAIVKELRPDVITLDVMMPGMSGFETVERLRADTETAEIPIVLVTGRSQAADVARGERLGVEAYLSKPFEPSELVSVVRRLAEFGRPTTDASSDA
jgi:CheY-like chemotaxis protein